MTGVASPEKAPSSKKKGERKCATKDEYRQLSSIMAAMNNLRKQVCRRTTAGSERSTLPVALSTVSAGHPL